MKLKRFSAPDIRQAINKVRDELGPDAVILSNRSTGNGVEIIAAIDYDDAILDKSSEEISDAIAKQHIESSSTTAAMPEPPRPSSRPTWNDYVAQATEPAPEPERPAPKAQKHPHQVSPEWLEKFKTSVEERFDQKTTQPTANPKTANVTAAAENTSASHQDLEAVWGELHNIRGLLENQLSSLAWHDVTRRFPQRAKVLRHLYELGLSPAMAQRLVKEIKFTDEFENNWRKVLALFASRIPVRDEDVVQQGGVFALVGPTGVGKTTTIAKIAARYALTHGTKGIALITTDNYRIGAQEQLRTYGRILGAPVRVANDAQELKKTLKSLYDKQLILIDTAGMSQRDIRLTEQFAMLSEGSSLIKTFLVLPAASQLQVMDETVKAYSKAVLEGCIITKTDETGSLGGVLSTVIHHQLPVAYYSDGQRVPEDLHQARAIDLVKQAVSLLKKSDFKADDETMEIAFGGIAANDLV